MPKIIAFLIFVSGLIGLFFGGKEIIWQSQLLRGYVPVPATVITDEIPGLQSRLQSSFVPHIEYRYTVTGREYRSTNIWPYPQTLDRTTAPLILRDYPAGKAVDAYINPQRPDEAVLIRTLSAQPYWLTAFAIAVAAMGCGRLLGVLFSRRFIMHALPADRHGWVPLLPTQTLRERMSGTAFLLAATAVPMVILAVNLFISTTDPYAIETASFLATAVLILAGLGVHFARLLLFTRRLGELRLYVNKLPLKQSTPITFRVSADVQSTTEIQSINATLSCMRRELFFMGRRTSLRTVRVGECPFQLRGPTVAERGARLSDDAQINLDPRQFPRSGKVGTTTYPYHFWQLEVVVRGAPTYSTTFPLSVE